MAILARDKGFNGLILPRENAPEAAVVEEIEVIGIGTLAEAVGFLTDQLPLEPTVIDIDAVFADASRYEEDFSEVRGQESVKRAVTVAAAGGDNVPQVGTSAGGKLNRRYRDELRAVLGQTGRRDSPESSQIPTQSDPSTCLITAIPHRCQMSDLIYSISSRDDRGPTQGKTEPCG